jgi:hypothetical protein
MVKAVEGLDTRISRLKGFERDLQYLADKTCIGNRPEAEAELVKIRAEIVYLAAQKHEDAIRGGSI